MVELFDDEADGSGSVRLVSTDTVCLSVVSLRVSSRALHGFKGGLLGVSSSEDFEAEEDAVVTK